MFIYFEFQSPIGTILWKILHTVGRVRFEVNPPMYWNKLSLQSCILVLDSILSLRVFFSREAWTHIWPTHGAEIVAQSWSENWISIYSRNKRSKTYTLDGPIIDDHHLGLA